MTLVLAGVACLSLLISVLNALVLLLTYQRSGRWRESDDAKALIDRVGKAEGDITGLKVRMENVATKADVARATAEIEAGTQHIRRVEVGVERIESYLMNQREKP